MSTTTTAKSAASARPSIVIRASAGAGKTYQLTSRYLQLVHGGAAPEQILAATFARKAAGEILDRVVQRLAEAIEKNDELAKLRNALEVSTLTRERCVELLRLLTSRLHRLQIGTLDSFFMQLTGHYGLEIGLPLGWRIVETLEDANLRQEAIQRVLAEQDTADSVQLMRLLSKGDASRSVTRQILEIVDSGHLLLLETTPEMWDKLPRPKPMEDAAVAAAIERLAALPPFAAKNWNKAHLKAVGAARAGAWHDFLCEGIGCALQFNDGLYYSKPVDPAVEEIYAPLVRHAKAILVARVVDQTKATHRLLTHFDEAYRGLKRERRVMRFDDVTRELASALTDGRLDDVAFRLDGRITHLLLDEFQDTSRDQWRAIRPFALRATGETAGGSVFCVGDTKQAIYGWRGGVAEIFESATGEIPNIQQRELAKSHRSAQPVIDVVNRSFLDLSHNKALEQFPKPAADWAKRFSPHSTAKTELQGYCRLITAPKADEPKPRLQNRMTLSFAAQRVAELANQHPGRSIGVLVRENAAVAQIIYYLRQKKVFASEEGGNPLTDSPAVQLALSLLRLADHPGDRVAGYHVATSPLAAAVGFTDHRDREAAQRLALEIRERLLTCGYGQVIYGWMSALSSVCDERDLNRLMQLVELAYVLDNGKLRRPDNFVAEVETRRVEDPASAPIRVMTVHQAKGLEFDIVVLPQLDRPLKGQTPRLAVERPSPLEDVTRVCRYCDDTVQKLLPPDMAAMFKSWGDAMVSEALCVLYVALTRAVHRLEMIIAPTISSEKTFPKTAAGLLRSALATPDPAPPSTVLYEHGDPDWDRPIGGARSKSSAARARMAPESLSIKLAPSDHRRRGLDSRSPSSLEGGGKVDLSLRLRIDASESLARGKLLHAWLQQIEWLEQGSPDDETLRQLAGPLVASGADLKAEIRAFRQLLARPNTKAALSRGGQSPAPTGAELELRREWRFAYRTGDTIVEGAIDRLMLVRHGDRWLSADILDFKTDVLKDAAAAGKRADFYRPQIEAYRQAVAALTGLPPEKITARLLFTAVDTIHEIE